LNSHATNTASTTGLVMAMLHFKFTKSLKSKIDYAINSGAYVNNSRKYHCYGKLYTKIKQLNSSLTFDKSVKFTGVESIGKYNISFYEKHTLK
jgi:hypothetical protein